MTTNQPSDALDTLGTVLTGRYERDAIHLAVVQAIAIDRLLPSQRVAVTLRPDGEYNATTANEGIGLVDPFLPGAVGPGERFWVVIYPRTITSLRHEWTHPDLPTAVVSDKADSEAWLRNYLSYEFGMGSGLSDGYLDTFESFMKRAAVENDEYLLVSGRDASGNLSAEFKHHLEVYLGRPVAATYWSCSC